MGISDWPRTPLPHLHARHASPIRGAGGWHTHAARAAPKRGIHSDTLRANAGRSVHHQASPRAARYDARFRAFGAGEVPPGFNSKQFNSNVVVRWEYRPASTLFVVWQQGRAQEDRHLGTCETRRDLNDLFDALSSNTVLVKLSYWFNP